MCWFQNHGLWPVWSGLKIQTQRSVWFRYYSQNVTAIGMVCAVSRKVQCDFCALLYADVLQVLTHNHDQEQFLSTADKILQVLGHWLRAVGWQRLAAVSCLQGIWSAGWVLRGTALMQCPHKLQNLSIGFRSTRKRTWTQCNILCEFFFHIPLQNIGKVRDCLHPVTKSGCGLP